MARMTYKEAARIIGRKGKYLHGNIQFQVELLDVREVFGRTDVEIKPVAGTGTAWVSLDKVSLS